MKVALLLFWGLVVGWFSLVSMYAGGRETATNPQLAKSYVVAAMLGGLISAVCIWNAAS